MNASMSTDSTPLERAEARLHRQRRVWAKAINAARRCPAHVRARLERHLAVAEAEVERLAKPTRVSVVGPLGVFRRVSK